MERYEISISGGYDSDLDGLTASEAVAHLGNMAEGLENDARRIRRHAENLYAAKYAGRQYPVRVDGQYIDLQILSTDSEGTA